MIDNDTRRLTLRWIVIPMLLTFTGQRAYLHFLNPNSDLFVAGYNVHHLFTGALLEIHAAIVLILGIRGRIVRRIACAVFGIGTSMVLDEVIYLITTDGSNAAYLTPVSFWGAIVLLALAILVATAVYRVTSRS